MSKNVNTTEAATTATTILDSNKTIDHPVITAKELQAQFEQYSNVSIRKLSAALSINYGVLLKKSKEPIVGEAYDPEATNWGAIAATISSTAGRRRDYAGLDWDALNEGPNRKGASLQKSIEAFNVGDKVYLRKNNAVPYEILYKTATHVVIMLQGTSEPQAWANNTFLINGPVFQPRAEKVTISDTDTKEVK